MRTQKQNIWKEHLDVHWDHRHNTHILRRIIRGLSGKPPPPHSIPPFHSTAKITATPKNIVNCFVRQFASTVRPTTNKADRSIDRATQNMRGYNITLTATHVQEEIRQGNSENSRGPGRLNIRHLRQICPLGTIPNPNRDIDKGTSYRTMSPHLSNCNARRAFFLT